ncbi:MAG: hypothetical protein ACHQIM_21605, partial [Sphingobacteriales bacterium]
MKKQIIVTLILLIATAFITVVYFKNLNPPGTKTSRVMGTIPGNAALIFEFNNDQGFYDIFTGNKLLAAVIGKQKIGELDTLRRTLLLNPSLERFFTGQNIFISLHPSKTNATGLLLTISAINGFEPQAIEQAAKHQNSGLLITPLVISGRQGFTIYITSLKKRFYVTSNAENIFSGSFSKELIEQSTSNENGKNKLPFTLLPARQNANSLANLYVNYSQLTPLFDQLFSNRNTDIFKNFRLLPGMAALTLNYKTDALMFSGSTAFQQNKAACYLSLFTGQQPIVNHLKDIFPSTTAYSLNFAVSDPLKFGSDLAKWYVKAGINNERDQSLRKIIAETGVNMQTEFNKLLGNEFAIVTTRYFEKFGIVAVNDGSKLKILLSNISKMTDENSGQFIYEKIPFFLLGDTFSQFRLPYFIIIDNYLILANSSNELASYYDSYINRKFLSKNDQYSQFDNLLAARSNVAFLINFKNSEPILKRDLKPDMYDAFRKNEPGWGNFYAASLQFTSADKNFYTNFSMRLNTDTT